MVSTHAVDLAELSRDALRAGNAGSTNVSIGE